MGTRPIETLKRRREFLAVRGGWRASKRGFLLEAKAPPYTLPGGGPRGARFGFTVTKKLGNAVCRNFIRRRLKHAVRSAAVPLELPPLSYVIVARRAAFDMPFALLVSDMNNALCDIARRYSAGSGSAEAQRPKH